jgi:hypothetical protein
LRRAILLFVLAAAACDDLPTSPGSWSDQTGRAEAVLRDSPAFSATASGTLSGNMYASLWDGDRWIDLGSPNGITVPLQVTGRLTTIHGEQDAPEGSYTRVRLVLQGVTARIAAGSVIGGTVVNNETSVTLGGADQRAELNLSVAPFTVIRDQNATRTIIFDLASQSWLTPSVLQAGRVEDAALVLAVTASTRLDR